MSWVRHDRESFPDLPHRPANAQLYDTDMMVVSREPGRKYPTNRVLNPGPRGAPQKILRQIVDVSQCYKRGDTITIFRRIF